MMSRPYEISNCLDYNSLLRLYRIIDSSDEEVLTTLQSQSKSPIQLPEGLSDKETKLMKLLQLDRFEENLCDDYSGVFEDLTHLKFANSLLDNVINIPDTFTEEKKTTVRYDMLHIMRLRCIMLHQFVDKDFIQFESNIREFDDYPSNRKNKLNSKTGNIITTNAATTADHRLLTLIPEDECIILHDGKQSHQMAQTEFEMQNVRSNKDFREQFETILIGFRVLLLHSERADYREKIGFHLNGFFSICGPDGRVFLGNESEVETAILKPIGTILNLLNSLPLYHLSAPASYITSVLSDYFISGKGSTRIKQQRNNSSTINSELSLRSTSKSSGHQNPTQKKQKICNIWNSKGANKSEVVISQYPSIKPQQLRVRPDIILEFINTKETDQSLAANLHRVPIEVKYVQNLNPDNGRKNFHEFVDQTLKQMLMCKGHAGIVTNLKSFWLLSPLDKGLETFELEILEIFDKSFFLKFIGFLIKGHLKEFHHKRKARDCPNYPENWKIFNKVQVLGHDIDYHQARMSLILLEPDLLKIRIGMNRIFTHHYMNILPDQGHFLDNLKLCENTKIKGYEQLYDANQLSEALESEMKAYFHRSENPMRADVISKPHDRYSVKTLFTSTPRLKNIGNYVNNHFQVIRSDSVKVISVLKGSEFYGEMALNVVLRINPVDQKSGHTFGGIKDKKSPLIMKLFDPSRIQVQGSISFMLPKVNDIGKEMKKLRLGVMNNILVTSKLFLKELLSLIILGDAVDGSRKVNVPEVVSFGYMTSSHNFDKYNLDIDAGTTLDQTAACEGFFLIMKELVEEELVDNRVEKRLDDDTLDRALKVQAVREYCTNSFLNLTRIHDHFITHGDISRRNCIFKRDSVHLLDFGLATVLVEQDQPTEEPVSANTMTTLSSRLPESKFLNVGNLLTVSSLNELTYADNRLKTMFENCVHQDLNDLGNVLICKFPEFEDLVITVMQEVKTGHSHSP